jgi:hypothetical protein
MLIFGKEPEPAAKAHPVFDSCSRQRDQNFEDLEEDHEPQKASTRNIDVRTIAVGLRKIGANE